MTVKIINTPVILKLSANDRGSVWLPLEGEEFEEFFKVCLANLELSAKLTEGVQQEALALI